MNMKIWLSIQLADREGAFEDEQGTCNGAQCALASGKTKMVCWVDGRYQKCCQGAVAQEKKKRAAAAPPPKSKKG